MSEHRYIGKTHARPDAGDKAAGRAHYIHDLSRPGMLIGKVKFSDHAHARIKHIDTSRAERLPGVHAVLTAANTAPIRFGFLRDNLVLKSDKVRQFRDEIAAVAAVDLDTAKEAIELIKVEYEPLPGVFDPHQALLPEAPLVHEVDPRGRSRQSNLLDLRFSHRSGDLEQGRQAARYTAQGVFSTPWIQQSCMGTAGCIAEFDLNHNLTIWAKTQIPFLAQRDYQEALASMGLAGKNARVIVPTLGGGFGTGLDTHAYEFISILLAHHTARPVKIVYSRQEEFACLSPRQSCEVTIEQGLDAEGRLAFRHIEVLQDNGAYTSWGATYPTVMLLPATSLYRVPHILFDAKLVYTNNTYSQAMRGYGNPELTWALESNLDDLAQAASMDPLEIRRINCNQPDQETPMGLKVTSCALAECLDGVAKKLDWKSNRGQHRNKKRGVGLASLFHVGGGARIYRSDACGLSARLDDYGNVYLQCGGVEMGQGLHSVLSLSMAEALGVLPEKVFIAQTDTATCPWDVGTHASRGAFMACNAAILVANKLRQQIFAYAKELFPQEIDKQRIRLQKKDPHFKPEPVDIDRLVAQGEFELQQGLIWLKDAPDQAWLKVTLDKLLRAVHFRQQGQNLCADAFYDPPNETPDWKKGQGNMSATYTWGTQGAQVEVDTQTGKVHILKLVAVHDVGRVLNPQLLMGQTYGALAQGLGYALYEQVKSENGRILNPDFRDYKIPTIAEMDFPIEIEFIESNDIYGPFGAKGIGEPGLVPTASAIANAIYDAVGIRIRDLPITPEKVLQALADKQADDSGPNPL